MTEDRCVFCGEVVPEGRQVCPVCERPVVVKKITNRDRLRVASDEQVGDWIATVVLGLSGERRRTSADAWARYMKKEAL